MFFNKRERHTCKLCGVRIYGNQIVCYQKPCFDSLIQRFYYKCLNNTKREFTDRDKAKEFNYNHKEQVLYMYNSVTGYDSYSTFDIKKISLDERMDEFQLESDIAFVQEIKTRGLIVNVPCQLRCLISLYFYNDNGNMMKPKGLPDPYAGEIYFCSIPGLFNEKDELDLTSIYLQIRLDSHVSKKEQIINKLERCMSNDILLRLRVNFQHFDNTQNIPRGGRNVQQWTISMHYSKKEYKDYVGVHFINNMITVEQ